MAIKKAIYKVDNGTDFDEIHLKTSSDMVVFDNDKYFIGESCYNFTNGILMKTNIPATIDCMVDVHIEGNGYQSNAPIDTRVCFYNYASGNNSTMLNATAIANGLYFEVKAFIHNNVVCVWIPCVSRYNTVRFKLGTHIPINNLNYTLVDNSVPSATKLTTIKPEVTAKESEISPIINDINNIKNITNFNLGIPGNVRKLAGVAKKQNKLVSLEGFVCQYYQASSNGFVSGDKIANIPEGYRPTVDIRKDATIGRVNGHPNTIGDIEIKTNGDVFVKLILDSTAFNNVYFSASYLI